MHPQYLAKLHPDADDPVGAFFLSLPLFVIITVPFLSFSVGHAIRLLLLGVNTTYILVELYLRTISGRIVSQLTARSTRSFFPFSLLWVYKWHRK